MPPSTRRRGDPLPPQFPGSVSDSDEPRDDEDVRAEEFDGDSMEGAIEAEMEDEEVIDDEELPGTYYT